MLICIRASGKIWRSNLQAFIHKPFMSLGGLGFQVMTRHELPRPFKKYGQYGYNVSLLDGPMGDTMQNPLHSRLFVYENGQLISRQRCCLEEVCFLGYGKFAHWEKELFFSTLDGSDPTINGRHYTSVWSDAHYFSERCQYFHATLVKLLAAAGLKPQDITGKNLLQISLGGNNYQHHGVGLLAVGYGANVTVVDKDGVNWVDSFHPDFLNYLIRQSSSFGDGFDGNRIRKILQRSAFRSQPFMTYKAEVKTFADVTSEKYDIQLSTLALRHFDDMAGIIKMLFQTGKSGATGCHSIDFRDSHFLFSRPLQYLLLSDDVYKEISIKDGYANGYRWRPQEVEKLFNDQGFINITTQPLEFEVDSKYITTFIPRLRVSGSRFAAENEKTLKQYALIYTMTKP